MEAWDLAISYLEQGQYRDAALSFVHLYQQGLYKAEILHLFDDVFLSPNLAEINQIYEKNRQCLSENYPEYFLPELPYLVYSLIPVEEDFFLLYSLQEETFFTSPFTAEQQLYLLLFTETLSSLTALQLQALDSLHQHYRKQAVESAVFLEAALSQKAFCTPEILTEIDRYHHLFPMDSYDQYFLAKYAYQTADYPAAYQYIKKALRDNQKNIYQLILLADICQATGQLLEEGQTRAKIYYANSPLVDQKEVETAFLQCVLKAYQRSPAFLADMLAHARDCFFFPRYFQFSIRDAKLEEEVQFMLAQFLPECTNTPRDFKDFVALQPLSYPDHEIAYHLAINTRTTPNHYQFIKTNTHKSVAKNFHAVEITDSPVVVPVAGLDLEQKLCITENGETLETELWPSAFQYYRIEQNCALSSDKPFILGKPIPLIHEPKRKKLVLNIFLDAGAYTYLEKTQFQNCPTIKAFFEQGIIFGENYSTGEFTAPVYPSLHTGLYAKNHQFFDTTPVFLDESIKTLEERFQAFGYTCACFTSQCSLHLTDNIRGYDKVVNRFAYSYPMPELVNDVLEYLQAFPETDHYICMDASDLHRVTEKLAYSLPTQSLYPYQAIYQQGHKKGVTSVFQPQNEAKAIDYSKLFSLIDSQLQLLFSYIETHYKADEYLVSLSSDHGVSILDQEPWLLKQSHTKTLFMLRGAGIPSYGILQNEMTSALDLYPTLCHMAKVPYDKEAIDGCLPKALGGSGRTETITESTFTGQTYKLTIRDLQYEFRLETKAFTNYEFRVDLSAFTSCLYDRQNQQVLQDASLQRHFLKLAFRHLQNRQIHPSLKV